jgi:SNF family Na+-dependent transporter
MNYQLLIAVTISWIIVYLCIKDGVEGTGKVAIFTVTSPYILLTIFLIRTSLLDGFGYGMRYLFYPDFSKLFTFQIWNDALVQVAFQLSIGQGTMTTFASFRKPSNKFVAAGVW